MEDRVFWVFGFGFCLLKNNEISDKHGTEKEFPQNKNNIAYQIDGENIAALPLTMNLIIYIHSSPQPYMAIQLSVWPATTLLFWFTADVIFSCSRQVFMNKQLQKSTAHYLLCTKQAQLALVVNIVEHLAAKELDISLKSW